MEDDMTPEQEAQREREAQDAFDRMARHLTEERERRGSVRNK